MCASSSNNLSTAESKTRRKEDRGNQFCDQLHEEEGDGDFMADKARKKREWPRSLCGVLLGDPKGSSLENTSLLFQP